MFHVLYVNFLCSVVVNLFHKEIKCWHALIKSQLTVMQMCFNLSRKFTQTKVDYLFFYLLPFEGLNAACAVPRWVNLSLLKPCIPKPVPQIKPHQFNLLCPSSSISLLHFHCVLYKCTPATLTEVFECLFDLLGGQVEPGVRCDEGSVQPVIVVVAVDGVSTQSVHRQLLL